MRVRVEASAGAGRRPTVHGWTDRRDPAGGAVVELLRRADVAMYQAKRGGPRVVRYDAAATPPTSRQLMLGGDLPRAIADREFTVSFQPIVDLATGQMVSAEALARWRHPERGRPRPAPVPGRGRAVRAAAGVRRGGARPGAGRDEALAGAGRGRAGGGERLAAQPARPDVPADGAPTGWPATAWPASDLVIELTETLTLSQVDLVGGVLRQLRDAGVRLALDDFGTRYSSLAMLAKVPFFELKIDRSFVSGDEPLARGAGGGPVHRGAGPHACTATWWPRASSATEQRVACGRWAARPAGPPVRASRCRSTTLMRGDRPRRRRRGRPALPARCTRRAPT